MNRISSVAHASAGVSGALLEEEGRTALDSAQPELSISQMSRVFGVSLRTLRFYEDRGLEIRWRLQIERFRRREAIAAAPASPSGVSQVCPDRFEPPHSVDQGAAVAVSGRVLPL